MIGLNELSDVLSSKLIAAGADIFFRLVQNIILKILRYTEILDDIPV